MNRQIKMIKIKPIKEVRSIKISIVSVGIDSNDSNEFLDFSYEQIGCRSIDVATLGSPYEENHYSVTVDDEGLLVSGNVVMELRLKLRDGQSLSLELCGTLLIGHCGYIDGNEQDGLYELGLTEEQISYFMKNIQIDVIGITR